MGRKLQELAQTGFFHQEAFQEGGQSALGLLRLNLSAKVEMNGGSVLPGPQHLPLCAVFPTGT